MKKILLTVLFSTGILYSFAQNNVDLNQLGCATPPSQKQVQWIYDFFSSPQPVQKTTLEADTIPLSIHIVGMDNGTGYYKLDYLFQIVCELNMKYAPVKFYYYIQWPLDYINNSDFFEHNWSSGSQMMDQNEVINTVNVYFVGDPSGACGYYAYGPDGIAIKNSCSSPASTTLTHELGHYFGLPHTFSGWENGNIPSNPEKVTRGAGANCSSAGDGFCDTDADYISDRWYCPYTGVKYDQNNQLYHPDSSLYMSYSLDACQNRFSNQQITVVQNKLHQTRTYLMNQPHIPYSALSDPEFIFPVDSMFANFKNIKWKKVPGAQYYQVKISYSHSPIFILQEALVSDTFFNTTLNLNNGSNYMVKVYPLGLNVCKTKVGSKTFIYSNTNTSLSVPGIELEAASFSISPNPSEGDVQLKLHAFPTGNYQLQLFTLNGQLLKSDPLRNLSGNQSINYSAGNIPAGIYFLMLSGNGMQKVQKLVIR